MTQLLQRALAEAQKLSDEEQDSIARLILEEIEDDRLWDEAFKSSQPELAAMAREARAERAAGLTDELDPDTM